jgi:hypothetical protein
MSLSCFRSQNREAFLKYMKAEHVAWIKEHTAGTTNFVKLFTINNIKVSFFDTGKEAENQQLKFKAAQAAVTAVSARLALPPFVNVYATSDDISYGFVDRTSDEMQPATGHILLGKSVVTIRPQENDDTVTIASQPYKLRGGGTAGGRRLVADQIYDSASGGAAEKKQALVLTCCFHELGHVLHAYNSESAYYDTICVSTLPA